MNESGLWRVCRRRNNNADGKDGETELGTVYGVVGDDGGGGGGRWFRVVAQPV